MTLRAKTSVKHHTQPHETRRATISDVAEASGLSTAMVSYVLNGAPRSIPEATRTRVLAAARTLGYQPSAAARQMRGVKLNTLGVAFDRPENFLTSEYLAAILDGVLSVALAERQNLLFFIEPEGQAPAEDSSLFSVGRCDGILLFEQHNSPALLQSLRDSRIPLVLVHGTEDDAWVSSVDVDSVTAAREATAYLLGLGHRRIAHLTSDPAIGSARRRLQGYREALADAGVPFVPDWVRRAEYREDEAWEQVRALLALPAASRPTAIFAANDPMAVGAVRAAQSLGLRVPQDVSVLGFDDLPAAQSTDPPLSVVRQPTREVGRQSALSLLALIRDEAAPGLQTILPTELIVRGSTGPPAAPLTLPGGSG